MPEPSRDISDEGLHNEAILSANRILTEQGTTAGAFESMTADAFIRMGSSLPTPYGKKLKELYDALKPAIELQYRGRKSEPNSSTTQK